MKISPSFILCLNLLLGLSAFGAGSNGSVTISGTAEVGQTLTADNNLSDADGLGAITYQWYRDGDAIKNTLRDGVGGVDGLDIARGVTLSADGKHAYVTGDTDDAVSWYERNASTGALTYGGMLKDGVGGVDGLDRAWNVMFSADGKHAYVAASSDHAVSWYERNSTTGVLTYGGMLKDGVGGVDGLQHPYGVTLSADGKHAYVTRYSDDAVSWYERNASTGALTYGGMLKDSVNGVDGLDGVWEVTLSPDGKHAYVTGQNDNVVSWYERNASTGALTYFNANQSTYTLTAADGDSVITVVASYTDGANNPERVSSAGTTQVQGSPTEWTVGRWQHHRSAFPGPIQLVRSGRCWPPACDYLRP